MSKTESRSATRPQDGSVLLAGLSRFERLLAGRLRTRSAAAFARGWTPANAGVTQAKRLPERSRRPARSAVPCSKATHLRWRRSIGATAIAVGWTRPSYVCSLARSSPPPRSLPRLKRWRPPPKVRYKQLTVGRLAGGGGGGTKPPTTERQAESIADGSSAHLAIAAAAHNGAWWQAGGRCG